MTFVDRIWLRLPIVGHAVLLGVAAAAVFGALAYFTDSTLPGMVIHAGGNVFSAFDLLPAVGASGSSRPKPSRGLP